MDRKRCVLELVRGGLSADKAKQAQNNLSITLRRLQSVLGALADMPEESAEKKSDVDALVVAQLAAEQPTVVDPAAALRRAWREAYLVYRYR